VKRKFKRKIKVDESSPVETPDDEGQEVKTEETEQVPGSDAEEAATAAEIGEKKSKSKAEKTTDIELDTPENSEEKDSKSSESEEEQEDELSLARRESAENLDKFLRTAAEMENIKKRNIKERQELIKYAGENLARDLLDVADGLELALHQDNKGSLEEFVKGVELIRSQLGAVLDRHQITSQSLLGEDFQPEKAEALATIPTEGKKVGKVLEEFKKAYYFKDKLLRPAQVVVGKEAVEKVEPETTEEDDKADSSSDDGKDSEQE